MKIPFTKTIISCLFLFFSMGTKIILAQVTAGSFSANTSIKNPNINLSASDSALLDIDCDGINDIRILLKPFSPPGNCPGLDYPGPDCPNELKFFMLNDSFSLCMMDTVNYWKRITTSISSLGDTLCTGYDWWNADSSVYLISCANSWQCGVALSRAIDKYITYKKKSTGEIGWIKVSFDLLANPITSSINEFLAPCGTSLITTNTISVSTSSPNTGSVSGGGIYNSGTTTAVIATPDSGYVFTNWTENGNIVSTQANYHFAVITSQNLVASFSVIPTYSISVSANPTIAGSVSGGGIYNSGTQITLIATTNLGYVFTKWTESGNIVSNDANFNIGVISSRNLVANYSVVPTYSVSVSANPTNAGNASGGGIYNSGTKITLSASPNVSYAFTNWTEGVNIVSTNATYTFTITANGTLLANFSRIACTTLSQTITPCAGQSVTVGPNTYTVNGTYRDTLTDGNGCDSIVHTAINTNSIDTSITQSGTSLIANAINALYQWLDCSNADTAIASAIHQSYTPHINGVYAVIITKNSCSDTSACIPLNPVGIDDSTEKAIQITVFPNPTTRELSILFKQQITGGSIKIIDTNGQIILEKNNLTGKRFIFNIENVATGIYFIESTSNGNFTRTKFYKK